MDLLLFTNDVERVVLSTDELQNALDQLTLTCTTSKMKINTGGNKAIELSKEQKHLTPRINGKLLNQISKFKLLVIAFSEDGKQVRQIDRRIFSASRVLHSLYLTC
jgi:hypothetical protein